MCTLAEDEAMEAGRTVNSDRMSTDASGLPLEKVGEHLRTPKRR
jgi:hypothetical protein